MGRHESEIDQDGQQKGREVPPDKGSDSGGGKHEKGK